MILPRILAFVNNWQTKVFLGCCFWLSGVTDTEESNTGDSHFLSTSQILFYAVESNIECKYAYLVNKNSTFLAISYSNHFTQWICQNLLKWNPRRQTEELIKTATLLQELIGDCSPPRVCIRSLSVLCCLSPSPDSIKIAVWKCTTMSERLTCAPDLFASPVKRFK